MAACAFGTQYRLHGRGCLTFAKALHFALENTSVLWYNKTIFKTGNGRMAIHTMIEL